jgi:beta-lactamase superfamily II metal-dependent hydrolase
LLTGDSFLKSDEDFNPFYNYYSPYYIDKTLLFQIPHHGSKHNYNKKINFKPNIISVISAGINNKFKHPDNETLKNIAIQNGIVILVTEEEETKLIQSIYLRETYR